MTSYYNSNAIIILCSIVSIYANPADLSSRSASSNEIIPYNEYTAYSTPIDEQRADVFWTAFITYSYKVDDIIKEYGREMGKFGEGRVMNVTGSLVHIRDALHYFDNTGCNDFYLGNIPETFQSWIALIKRGNCTFDLKVENARRYGANGVIIYNDDRPNQKVEKMKIDLENSTLI